MIDCEACDERLPLTLETDYLAHVRYEWDETVFQREGRGRYPARYWKRKDFIPCPRQLAEVFAS